MLGNWIMPGKMRLSWFQAQTPDNLLQYQIQINSGQQQQQPQLQQPQQFPPLTQNFPQQPQLAPQQQPLVIKPLQQAQQLPARPPVAKPQQIIRKKPSLSSSRDNQITRPGSLFGKLRKHGDGFDDAGSFFKFDFHPEEKLAMSASLDYWSSTNPLKTFAGIEKYFDFDKQASIVKLNS